jgi:integrator complex subunit 4
MQEQDIYGILFSIGKNHGSFAANVAKHLAKEVSPFPNSNCVYIRAI